MAAVVWINRATVTVPHAEPGKQKRTPICRRSREDRGSNRRGGQYRLLVRFRAKCVAGWDESNGDTRTVPLSHRLWTLSKAPTAARVASHSQMHAPPSASSIALACCWGFCKDPRGVGGIRTTSAGIRAGSPRISPATVAVYFNAAATGSLGCGPQTHPQARWQRKDGRPSPRHTRASLLLAGRAAPLPLKFKLPVPSTTTT
jgi:hypothetical protein